MTARKSRSDEERSHRRAGLLAAAAVFILGAGAAVAGGPDADADSTKLEDVGPEEFNAIGEEATGAVCTQCHGWDSIFGGPRQTPGQWDFIVSDMVARGATATPEQLDLIRRYLKWAWGVVWINSASAEELAAVVGLPKGDAETVIAWREEHGPFANLDSLKDVPGIDSAAIEAQADAIMFN